MLTPVVVVNFKTYRNGTGQSAVELAKICEEVGRITRHNIIVAVQDTDIYRIAQSVSIPVFAQDIEPISPGAHTGHTLPEAVKESGAVGTLINHSEYRLPLNDIKEAIARAHQVGLLTIVCASTPELASEIAEFNPDMIAIEPPELIGGEVSVSTAQPSIITDAVRQVKLVKEIPVLCGAGIKDKKDVEISSQLGAEGILVASHVVKAEDPKKILTELANGLD